MIKKILLIITSFLLINISQAQTTSTDAIMITDYANTYLTPSSLYPGTDGSLYLTVLNAGSGSTAYDAKIQLLAHNVLDLSTDIKPLGNIPFGDSRTAVFRVSAETSTPAGVYLIKARITYEPRLQYAPITSTWDVPIVIEESNRIIISKTSFDDLKPGRNATLNVSISNIGISEVFHTSINIDTEKLNEKIIPLERSIKNTGDLSPDQNASAVFNLAAQSDLSPGLYLIPLIINYYDERNVEYNISESIGLSVEGEPELIIYVEEKNSIKPLTEAIVKLTIANTGTENANYVSVRITNPKNEVKEVYIGTLRPDDYDTLEVNYMVGNYSIGTEQEIILNVTYKDPENNDLSIIREIPLIIEGSLTTSRIGGFQILIIQAIIIITMIVAAVILSKKAVRYFLEKRKEKGKQ